MNELGTTLPPGPLEPEPPETGDDVPPLPGLPSRQLPTVTCRHVGGFTRRTPDAPLTCVSCGATATALGLWDGRGTALDRAINSEYQERANLQEIRHDVTDMRARFDRFVKDVHQLNTAVGEFKRELVQPMMEEFKSLRYTLSDSAGSSVSQLHALAKAFDQRLNLVLTVIGKTPAEIAKIRTAAGIGPDFPTLAELEAEGAPAVAFESAIAANAALQKQNSRLIAEVEVLRKQHDRARALVRKKRRR